MVEGIDMQPDESPMEWLARREARRQAQKAENERVQRDEGISVKPPFMTLESMLENCIWISTGEMVADVQAPNAVLRWPEFRSNTSALRTVVEDGRKPRPLPTAVAWQQSSSRKTVETRTYCAGAGVFCRDPDGRTAVNAWRPIERWPAKRDVSLFVDQLAYLFPIPTEREAFTDWLAHIEQKPGELPHYGWLHVADQTGTGRNWLASVLARVWRGHVAPNVDLPSLLDGQFNDQLAGRVLAVVDEAQDASSEGRYVRTNRMKSLVNAEFRDINPKYGRKYREHNACRWLVFSNHINAIPIDDHDRRWRVAHLVEKPREPSYYASLYAALADAEFVNAVAVFLAERDISWFNPGERPPVNAAKAAVIGAGKSVVRQRADELASDWPADVITNADMADSLSDGEASAPTPAMRRAMEDVGAVSLPKPIKLDGKAMRLWVLRSHGTWLNASPADIAKEARRARANHIGPTSAVDVLAGIKHGHGESPL